MTETLVSPMATARRPIVAAGLSLALPGLGQFYNGQLNRAIWLFLGFALAGVPGVVIAALYAPSWLMAPLLALVAVLTLSLWIGGVIDAWRGAKAAPIIAPRREWQISGLYVLLFLLGNATLYFGLAQGMRAHFVQAFSIPSDSMAPGILRGDWIFADKRYNCPNCKGRVTRGDVGVFVYPNDRTMYYIKRVIGLPGDHVALKGRALYVNGERLSGSETREDDHVVVAEQANGRAWSAQWRVQDSAADAEFDVPPAQVFVLGDNRDESADSRKFGFVPLADMAGKARQIWWSWSGGPRWARIGKEIE